MDISSLITRLKCGENRAVARSITLLENGSLYSDDILSSLSTTSFDEALVIGITGPPGAGKSTMTSSLISYYLKESKKIGIIAIDPSSPLTGGAILGDRIRMMKYAMDDRVIMRSMATRGRLGGLCAAAGAAVRIMAEAGANPIIIETVGVGQSEMDIIKLADLTVVVSAPGLGDDIQAMKAGLLEVADIYVINKADLPGADILKMELGETAHERGIELLMTSATTGQGIDALGTTLQNLYSKTHQSGERNLRRVKAKRSEIVDWALKFLEDEVTELVSSLDHIKHDPRIEAREIIKKMALKHKG